MSGPGPVIEESGSTHQADNEERRSSIREEVRERLDRTRGELQKKGYELKETLRKRVKPTTEERKERRAAKIDKLTDKAEEVELEARVARAESSIRKSRSSNRGGRYGGGVSGMMDADSYFFGTRAAAQPSDPMDWFFGGQQQQQHPLRPKTAKGGKTITNSSNSNASGSPMSSITDFYFGGSNGKRQNPTAGDFNLLNLGGGSSSKKKGKGMSAYDFYFQG
jgi:hypothetical protein